MEVRILLENGELLTGKNFGSQGTTFGEVVFNTGMTGYQEILTDPSYAGQIVTMTYPLIGNYGVNDFDVESDGIQVAGFIVKEYCSQPSHWQMNQSLDTYLKSKNIMGVYGIDTRKLTKIIRRFGAMNCVMTTDTSISLQTLKDQLSTYSFPRDIVERVSVKEKETILPEGQASMNIGLIDLGIKKGIIRQLLSHGCQVTVYPSKVKTEEVVQAKHDAVFFSNGPGDPKDCKSAITLAKELKDQLPIFGICLGHQILALSLGGDTYKLKFGHRGSNHPVMDLRSQKVYMTAQNHGFAVDKESLPKNIELTHINVNDETVEGIASKESLIESVQFHPEEGPGPTDAHQLFGAWLAKIERK